MVERTKGRRPQKPNQVTQGADSELPGWQPKETASLLPQEGTTLKSACVGFTAQSVRRAKNPGVAAPKASARVACVWWTAGWGRSTCLSSFTVASDFVSQQVPEEVAGPLFLREQETEGR